jgi:signal transduction histidine kinase
MESRHSILPRHTGWRDVILQVEDSGPGIPEDELVKVFDRFYRVEHGRSREAGGAGLGLSIARWSVETHGGAISAHGTKEGGSTFRIVLPACLEDAPDFASVNGFHGSSDH